MIGRVPQRSKFSLSKYKKKKKLAEVDFSQVDQLTDRLISQLILIHNFSNFLLKIKIPVPEFKLAVVIALSYTLP